MKPIWSIVISFTLIVVFTGCSTPRKPLHHTAAHHLPPGYLSLEDARWWSCKFTISWPEEEDQADFSTDLFLAHAVSAPVLVNHISSIPYWRFHRRGKRDEAGHQFSFAFFSNRDTAEHVFSEIKQTPLLQLAIEEHIIEKVTADLTIDPQTRAIEYSSDASWSHDLQKNWPSFIMGVSSMWLGLIDDLFSGAPDNYSDLNSLLKEYREIHKEITRIWLDEGHHAFFHHINALFGYEPVLIRKKMVF